MMISVLIATLLFVKISSVEISSVLEVAIPQGQQECFYQAVEDGETIVVEYMVTYSSGEFSKYDIDFKMFQPGGAPVVIEYRRENGHHRFAGGKLLNGAGDYKICFDNSFSFISSKTVYFIVDVKDESEEENQVVRSNEQPNENEFKANSMMFDVEMQLNTIKQKMLKASTLQNHMLIAHGKDMNLADQNVRRIDTTSLFLFVLFVLSGILQAYVIKEMFTIKI